MIIKDIMSTNIHSLNISITLLDACKMMKEYDIGFIPILFNNECVNVLTDRDIVILLSDDIPLTTKLVDVKTKPLITAYESENIEVAYHRLSENQICRLIILNKENKFVGILSISDLIKIECTNDKTFNLLYNIKKTLINNENCKSNYVKIDDFCL